MIDDEIVIPNDEVALVVGTSEGYLFVSQDDLIGATPYGRYLQDTIDLLVREAIASTPGLRVSVQEDIVARGYEFRWRIRPEYTKVVDAV
jgi:hypothetical protein